MLLKVLFLCIYAWSVVGQDINEMRNMPKYDARYDYLDVDAVLDSKRLVRNYVDCLINIKPCTPEGKALKRLLPEALRTKCVRCSDRQKKAAVKVIRRLKYEYPDEWAKLSSRWDPTGDFTRFFEEYLAKDYINTIVPVGNEIPGSSPLPPSPPPPPPRLPQPSPPVLPQPSPQPSPPSVQPTSSQAPASTPPRPIILNRFGDDGELIKGSPSGSLTTPQPTMAATAKPTMATKISRPITPPKPTQMTWMYAASDTMPTRYPMRPVDIQPPFSTAITLIDQIGNKIIKTTEIVTDILRNTVRAVVGR